MLGYHKVKILPKWKILQLYPLAFSGDKAAFEQLLWSVYGLVMTYMKRHSVINHDMDKLQEDALFGFVRGVCNGRWNPNKGSFVTYISFYIQRGIYDGENTDNLIRIPAYRSKDPGNPRAIYFDSMPEGFDVEDKHEDLTSRCIIEEQLADLKRKIELLPDKERKALVGNLLREQSLQTVGTEMGFTREYVRLLRNRAVRHLRKMLK